MGISKLFSDLKLGFIVHRPEILLGLGLASIAGGVVLACNASRKVDDVISETADNVEMAKIELTGVESEKAVKKEQRVCAWKLFKMYAPGAVLLVVGTGLIIKSHGEMGEKIASLGMALNDMAAAFTVYRGNVVQKFGEDVDKRMLYSSEATEFTEAEYIDEDGTSHGEVIRTVETGVVPPIAIEFGKNNINWNESSDLNVNFLQLVEDVANGELVRNGKFFMFQLKERLGLRKEVTANDYMVGWVIDKNNPGEEYDPVTKLRRIDLGIREAYFKHKNERDYSHDVSYVLTPNYHGYILDKI